MRFDSRTYTGLHKHSFGEHKQNLVPTRTQEKGAVTPQETDPDLPMGVQESPVEVWPAAGSGALKTTVPAQVLLKESPLSSLPLP